METIGNVFKNMHKMTRKWAQQEAKFIDTEPLNWYTQNVAGGVSSDHARSIAKAAKAQYVVYGQETIHKPCEFYKSQYKHEEMV